MKRERKTVDIVNGAMAPSLLRFALPLIAAGLLQRTFNAADVVVVGRFVGDNALAAVTSTTALIDLMINLFYSLSAGANVAAAQALGQGDRTRVQAAVRTAILLSLLGGAAVMTVGVIFSPALLRMMSSPESIIGQSALYLRIYFVGIPAQLLYHFGSALLRAGGDTRRPTLYLTAAGVLNVVLNLIFVVVLRMSVAGVGLATTISQFVSGGLVLRALMGEGGDLRLDLRRLRIDGASLRKILWIGLPAGIQSSLTSVSNVIIQSSVNSLGEAVMAGAGAADSIATFVAAGMNGFYHASLTFTGQNLGAGKPERIDSGRRWCVLMVAVTGLVLGGTACLFNRPLLGVYLRTPEAIAAGRLRLFLVALPYFMYGVADVFVGNMRGMGHSIPPMIISLLGMCAFRTAWVFTAFRHWHTPFALFVAIPISFLLIMVGQRVNLHFVRRRTYARIQ